MTLVDIRRLDIIILDTSVVNFFTELTKFLSKNGGAVSRRLVTRICDWVTFWVTTFEPEKIQKRTIPQNKRLNVINLEFPCNFLLKCSKVG